MVVWVVVAVVWVVWAVVAEVRNCLAFYNRNNHRRCCHKCHKKSLFNSACKLELKTVALLQHHHQQQQLLQQQLPGSGLHDRNQYRRCCHR